MLKTCLSLLQHIGDVKLALEFLVNLESWAQRRAKKRLVGRDPATEAEKM